MNLDCAGVSTHLSYCTNIHPGDTWSDTFTELQRALPLVRDAVEPHSSMGIGLRLSRKSADSLTEPSTLAEFKSWLANNHLYVFTLNGFPYGPFHGERVKEDVYKPDWTEQSRLEYTCSLADLLVKLDPPDGYGSISTLPGTFKDWIMPGSEALVCTNLVKAVAHCVHLYETTGITIALAIEPEPCCMMETVAETIQFFTKQLFSKDAIQQLSKVTGLNASQAEIAMRRHIGVCYDVCHSAVEFENPAHVIARLKSAGIEIVKLQLSSAMKISNVNESLIRQLTRFDEPVYLHQVVEQMGDSLTRYNDLKDAVTALRYRAETRSTLDPALQLSLYGDTGQQALAGLMPYEEPTPEWRVHFHVPIFTEKLEHFDTTQEELKQILQLQKLSGFCKHLEVETYTWDVLPETFRNVTMTQAIARELTWVKKRLV